jgi:uncharacterized membrane protein
MNRRAIIGAYVLGVFLSGVLVGGFAHRLYMVRSVNSAPLSRPRSPEEFRKRYMEEMRTRLHLSREQETTLSQILDETRDRFKELRDRTKPQMDAIQAEQRAIHEEQVAKVKAILNDPQKAEYDKMRAERARRKGPPPPDSKP